MTTTEQQDVVSILTKDHREVEAMFEQLNMRIRERFDEAGGREADRRASRGRAHHERLEKLEPESAEFESS